MASKDIIDCIGIDRKQHRCYRWADVTLCGVKVLRKKYLKYDWQLFSCYPCTY